MPVRLPVSFLQTAETRDPRRETRNSKPETRNRLPEAWRTVGWFQRARDWLNNLGSGGGGKRPRYRTHTDDGQEILIDAAETVIGNNEATAFFHDLCGGSLKEVMLRQGLTNVPMTGEAGDGPPLPVRGGRDQPALAMFRKFGIRVSDQSAVPIFAKPGTYPHVELGGGGAADLPEGGRPLVIASESSDRARPSHATVVLTVLDPRRRSQQKQVTIHFHGRGVIRAKGFARELGVAGRPIHYDGEEVRSLIHSKARGWSKRVYWCTAMERY